MSGLSGNQLVCFPSSPDVSLDSWENKANCFPRDLTLSVYCSSLVLVVALSGCSYSFLIWGKTLKYLGILYRRLSCSDLQ